MLISLSRGGRTAVVDSFGGELVSYRDDAGTEFIWSGDPNYWSGRNPILFPIVGKLKDNRVSLRGEVYEMANHGFARRMEFSLLEQGAHYAVLALRADEKTRAQYPFSFELRVRHELEERGFRTTFAVENRDADEMPFCIGAHPAFRCPLYDGEAFEDYVVRFDHVQTLPSRLCTEEGYIHAHETFPCLENSNTIPLRHEVFDRVDTLMLEGLRAPAAELVNPKRGHGVRMEFADFPVFALWTMPNKTAPYLCLEPWLGYNHITDEGEAFTDKRHCRVLRPRETAQLSYRVVTF